MLKVQIIEDVDLLQKYINNFHNWYISNGMYINVNKY